MSMLLFALVLNPVLYLLVQNLTGNRIGHCTTQTAVVAYVDDITIFVTVSEDIQVIRDLLRTYERAKGACLNIRKSKALVAGSWDTLLKIMDIPHCPEITIIGFRFTISIARSGNFTCSRVTGKVKALARDVYGTALCLIQRIQYVHTPLLSKIRHTAQIFSASKEHERQLLTAIS